MTSKKQSPAPRENADKPGQNHSQRHQRNLCQRKSKAEFDAMLLAGGALADAARLIASRALLAESAACRGEWQSYVDHMRIAAAGLAEAREIAAVVLRGRQ